MRAGWSEDEKSHRTGLPRSTERLLPAPRCARAGAPQSLASDTMPVKQRWLSISVGHVMKRPRAADSLSAVQRTDILFRQRPIIDPTDCTDPATYAMRPLGIGGDR